MKRKPPTQLEALQSRWHAKTGDPMPEWIANLTIEEIRRAVELTESGYTVAPGVSVVRGDTRDDGSMMDFDSHGFH